MACSLRIASCRLAPTDLLEPPAAVQQFCSARTWHTRLDNLNPALKQLLELPQVTLYPAADGEAAHQCGRELSEFGGFRRSPTMRLQALPPGLLCEATIVAAQLRDLTAQARVTRRTLHDIQCDVERAREVKAHAVVDKRTQCFPRLLVLAL